jgi:hypothetical protein
MSPSQEPTEEHQVVFSGDEDRSELKGKKLLRVIPAPSQPDERAVIVTSAELYDGRCGDSVSDPRL